MTGVEQGRAVHERLLAERRAVSERLAEHLPDPPDVDDAPPDDDPAPPDVDEPDERAGVRSVRLIPAAGMRMRATDWLWEGRIPAGEITLVGGREGEGKSTVIYDRFAAATRGELEGDYFGTPVNVAVAAAEDSWEQTIMPRLVAADADLRRVLRIDVREPDGGEGMLVLPADVDRTEAVIGARGVRGMLLDPFLSRLDGRLDSHKDADVRRALEPVKGLADRTRCATVGLIHVNKSITTDPLNAIMASRAFTAMARSVLFVLRDPDDEDGRRRLLGLVKANLIGEGEVPTMTFDMAALIVGHDPDSGKAIAPPSVQWGPDSSRSIREALEEAGATPELRTAVQECAVWMRDYLAQEGGVAWSKDVQDAGRKAGFSTSSVHRARRKLRLIVTSEGFPKQSRWSFGTSP